MKMWIEKVLFGCRAACRNGRRTNRAHSAAWAVVFAAWAGQSALAQEPPIIAPGLPNYVGVGVGFTPDYLGANEFFYGGLPFARYQFEPSERYVSLLGTFADFNVINHPIIRFGPTVQYRFGRSNVKDNAVDELSSVDATIEAGLFGALDFVSSEDPRKRVRVGASAQRGVIGEHDGYLVNATVQGWHPLGRYLLGGIAVGGTYGSGQYMSTYFGIDGGNARRSGLERYDANAGLRDGRVTLGLLMPVAEHWFVGAGFMYQRLLDDAADSPIVDDRGTANQFSGGVGVGYTW
jgi:outer membrane protein